MKGGTQEPPAAEAAPARVINVEVMELEREPFTETIRITGTVRGNRDVVVSAEESGRITRLFRDKGVSVRRGDPLVKIDDSVLRAQVAQAQAQADLAAETWKRRKRLWEEDQVGSEIAYLEAKFAAEQTAANLKALERRLARTTVRAPFDGIYDRRDVELGAMVAPGQAVARIVDLDPVKVGGGVPERYAPDVHPGTPASVTFDILPDTVFHVPVSFVGAAVEPRNRTFPIELELPNPDGLVKPEMVANIALRRRTIPDALVVPQDAVLRVEDGYVVFVAVADADGERAEQRTVRLGPSEGNRVVLEEGISPGERLIVVGQKEVADGDRVKIVEAR
ncbi:MAG: efflux RND transporter periplasmic adaptor subunit [Gemmatimonadota bacterium]